MYSSSSIIILMGKCDGRDWYGESGLLRHKEDGPMVVTLLGGLSGIDFQLSLNNERFDVGPPDNTYCSTPSFVLICKRHIYFEA